MGAHNKSNGTALVPAANPALEQYACIVDSGADASQPTAVTATAGTDLVIGVLQQSVAANAPAGSCALYVSEGETKAIASAAIGPETDVMPAANGRIAAWTTGNTRIGRTGDVGAAAAGDLVLIKLNNTKVVAT